MQTIAETQVYFTERHQALFQAIQALLASLGPGFELDDHTASAPEGTVAVWWVSLPDEPLKYNAQFFADGQSVCCKLPEFLSGGNGAYQNSPPAPWYETCNQICQWLEELVGEHAGPSPEPRRLLAEIEVINAVLQPEF